MHLQPNRAQLPDDPNTITRAILSLLVATEPTLWSTDELAREMQSAAGAATGTDNHHEVQTAIDTLRGAGLIHTHGTFAFATRAAVRAAELGD